VVEYGLEVPAAAPAALPMLTFADTLSLHLNGEQLVLLHVPAAHGDGDVIAWWSEANVVHLGDTYYAQGYPLLDVSRGGSLAGMVAAIETALARADGDTLIVPGHGPATDRDALAGYRDMLVAIGRRVRELVEEGRNLDEVLAAQPTASFDAQFGNGGVSPERFVRSLYDDLVRR
jgi:glyoxylase-like metal-dependent hydrolase (beta-lactamase superfamily II)